MWARTQKNNELIDLTGGKVFKKDSETFSICFTRTSELDTYATLAEYDKKKTRDFVFDMFEVSVVDGQTIFSFQNEVVTKMVLEFEKKMRAKA